MVYTIMIWYIYSPIRNIHIYIHTLPHHYRGRKRIHDELKFYDLSSSPLYRLSMANPVISHVNVAGKKNSSVPLNLRLALESNKDFALAYRQIFDLFEK